MLQSRLQGLDLIESSICLSQRPPQDARLLYARVLTIRDLVLPIGGQRPQGLRWHANTFPSALGGQQGDDTSVSSQKNVGKDTDWLRAHQPAGDAPSPLKVASLSGKEAASAMGLCATGELPHSIVEPASPSAGRIRATSGKESRPHAEDRAPLIAKDHRAVPMHLLALYWQMRGSARQHGKGEISSEKTTALTGSEPVPKRHLAFTIFVL